MSVLVLAEHDNKTVKKATLNTVAAAQKLGGQVHVLVAGQGVAGAAEQLKKYGVNTIWVADSPALANYTAEAYAAAAFKAAEAAQAAIVAASATTTGRDFLPRVAARLGAGMASEITGVEDSGGKLVFKRPMWAGNLNQWL